MAREILQVVAVGGFNIQAKIVVNLAFHGLHDSHGNIPIQHSAHTEGKLHPQSDLVARGEPVIKELNDPIMIRLFSVKIWAAGTSCTSGFLFLAFWYIRTLRCAEQHALSSQRALLPLDTRGKVAACQLPCAS